MGDTSGQVFWSPVPRLSGVLKSSFQYKTIMCHVSGVRIRNQDYIANALRQPLLERRMPPQLVYVTCFGIVLGLWSWVRKHSGGVGGWGGSCIPLSHKALITGVSPVSLIPAKHVTSRSTHSNPTLLWHSAVFKPWLTWVKCIKLHGCQIVKRREMYA